MSLADKSFVARFRIQMTMLTVSMTILNGITFEFFFIPNVRRRLLKAIVTHLIIYFMLWSLSHLLRHQANLAAFFKKSLAAFLQAFDCGSRPIRTAS